MSRTAPKLRGKLYTAAEDAVLCMSALSKNISTHSRGRLHQWQRFIDRAHLRNSVAFVVFVTAFYFAYRYGMSFSHTSSSPFWFPDAVLLCALLKVRPRRWWLPLLATLPIRLTVAVPPDVPLWFLVAVYAIDCAKAMLGAFSLRQLLADPIRFRTMREFGLYCLLVVLLIPAVSAFGGAAARYGLGNDYWRSG